MKLFFQHHLLAEISIFGWLRISVRSQKGYEQHPAYSGHHFQQPFTTHCIWPNQRWEGAHPCRPTNRFGYYKLISCAARNRSDRRTKGCGIPGGGHGAPTDLGAMLKIVQNLHFILTETVVAFEHTSSPSWNPHPQPHPHPHPHPSTSIRIRIRCSCPACYTILKQI